MERIRTQAKSYKLKKDNAKVITNQAKVTAKEFWSRWKGKDTEKTIPALLLELNKMDKDRVAEVLAFAKIINKFKPSQKEVAQ